MYKLEEADSQKARLAQEVEALKQEARKNQDTALDAFEKLSERQQALDRLQKSLAAKERELASMGPSPQIGITKASRWVIPASVSRRLSTGQSGRHDAIEQRRRVLSSVDESRFPARNFRHSMGGGEGASVSPFLLSCAYRESARGALGIRLKSEDGLDVAAAPPPSDSGNASPSNDNGNVSPASLVPFGDGGGQELALGDRAFPQWHGEQQQQELWEEKRREETVGSTVLGLPGGGVSEPPAAVALVDHPTQASILIRSDDENAVAEPRRTVAGTILGSADSAMTRAVVPSTKEHHDERVRGTETVVESLPSSETTGAGSGDSTEGGRASSDAFMLRPLHPTPTFSPGRMHSGVGRAGVGGGGVQAGLYGDVRDTGFE
ncbi:unnamed protein product, partial [Sphacelaria rigidula]